MALLQRDDLRITDVAARCGFEDSNYFSRQFRLVAGRTPREYRKATRLADLASTAHSEEWGLPILKN
jgi:AraC-like DNA-binding protein